LVDFKILIIFTAFFVVFVRPDNRVHKAVMTEFSVVHKLGQRYEVNLENTTTKS